MDPKAVLAEGGSLFAHDLEGLVAEGYDALRRLEIDAVVVLASTSPLAACWAIYR